MLFPAVSFFQELALALLEDMGHKEGQYREEFDEIVLNGRAAQQEAATRFNLIEVDKSGAIAVFQGVRLVEHEVVEVPFTQEDPVLLSALSFKDAVRRENNIAAPSTVTTEVLSHVVALILSAMVGLHREGRTESLELFLPI